MPRLRQSDATATGPSSKAGWPLPQAMFQSRAVPITRLPSAATKARPSAGRRPSRSRSEVLRARGVAEGLVEQRLARRDIGRSFATNGDHVRSFPARRAQACSPERIQSHEGKAEAALAASGVCQMW